MIIIREKIIFINSVCRPIDSIHCSYFRDTRKWFCLSWREKQHNSNIKFSDEKESLICN